MDITVFRQLREIKKIWYLRRAFLPECCFSYIVFNSMFDESEEVKYFKEITDFKALII